MTPAGALTVNDSSALRVLQLLEANPQLTQRELARELGVSLGKANYCLRAVLLKGFVKAQNFQRNKSKLAYIYLLTPEGVAAKTEMARKFLARKRVEYDALKLEIERLQLECEKNDAVPSLAVRKDDTAHHATVSDDAPNMPSSRSPIQ